MTSADLPEPIRRRMGLPPYANPVVESIKLELFANSRAYIRLILLASEGQYVDPAELVTVAQRAGKVPAVVNEDLNRAVVAYQAWRNSIDP